MKFIIFAFMTFLLVGCCETETELHYLLHPKTILSTEIGKKVFRQLKQEYNLYLAEYGWSMRGLPKIRGLHCAFNCYEELNTEKAREILLRAEELLLNEINADKRLHSHLTHHPFTPESIDIVIFIHNPDFSPLEFGRLCVASIYEATLTYQAHFENMQGLITIHSETYKEAKHAELALESVK